MRPISVRQLLQSIDMITLSLELGAQMSDVLHAVGFGDEFIMLVMSKVPTSTSPHMVNTMYVIRCLTDSTWYSA